MGRNVDDVARTHGPHVPVEIELDLSLQDRDDLLLLVRVHGRDGVRLEPHEADEQPLSEDRPNLEPGRELDRRDASNVDVAALAGSDAGRGAAREVLVVVRHPTDLPSSSPSSRPIRAAPSAISSSWTRLKASRMLFRPRSSGWNGVPGTNATP